VKRSTERTFWFLVKVSALVGVGYAGLLYGPTIIAKIKAMIEGAGNGGNGESTNGGQSGSESAASSGTGALDWLEQALASVSPDLQKLNLSYWSKKYSGAGMETESWLALVPPPTNPNVNLIPF